MGLGRPPRSLSVTAGCVRVSRSCFGCWCGSGRLRAWSSERDDAGALPGWLALRRISWCGKPKEVGLRRCQHGRERDGGCYVNVSPGRQLSE